jgi:hypothetical protein
VYDLQTTHQVLDLILLPQQPHTILIHHVIHVRGPAGVTQGAAAKAAGELLSGANALWVGACKLSGQTVSDIVSMIDTEWRWGVVRAVHTLWDPVLVLNQG